MIHVILFDSHVPTVGNDDPVKARTNMRLQQSKNNTPNGISTHTFSE